MHSEGPWRIGFNTMQRNGGLFTISSVEDDWIGSTRSVDADTEKLTGKEVMPELIKELANGTLMAAAPDLLAVCRGLIMHQALLPDDPILRNVLHRASAAITKATHPAHTLSGALGGAPEKCPSDPE